MRSIIRCTAVALLVAAPAVLAAQDFEGKITAGVLGGRDREPAEVVIYTKGGKSRMESAMGGMPMAMITDQSDGTITTLMAPQKMYMRMTMKEAGEQLRQFTGETTTPEAPKVTRTGKKETIAGRTCEHVLFEVKDGSQTDVCAAGGMGFFGGGGAMGGGRSVGIPAAIDQLKKDFKDGFFPLKIESVTGTERVQRMLVKTVEPQKVDAKLFEVPADYTEMKMPGMGKP